MTAVRTTSLPLVEPLGSVDSVDAFSRLSRLPHCLFLDSARRHPQLGQYSFLAADPFEFLSLPIGAPRPLDQLESRLRRYTAEAVPGVPPFQGGAAGLLSYDLSRSLERLPPPRVDEFQAPALAVGFYDVVLAIDHAQDSAWIISHGYPETEPAKRTARAEERIDQFRSWLKGTSDARTIYQAPAPAAQDVIPTQRLAAQFDVAALRGLTSNMSREGYLETISRAIEYIRAGDVFQVNLAQRLLYRAACASPELYLRLRDRNAATFAGYFDLGELQIVSASPERFVKLCGRQVETRPIKGTRPRTSRPEADLYAGDELKESEKDRAENVMIVDLMRNDLSRVCQAHSVRVTQLCQVEMYEYVQHLVSAVSGTLIDSATVIDLIKATFPGGSVTGAPKIRAMELIAELEPTARGPYCGAMGYLGFDGSMDTSILIRTITAGRGWWQAPVGGGIVAQSVPEREYEETWHKAEGMLRALIE